MSFQPQLSQQDLAEMIDREGLPFEVRKPGCKEWIYLLGNNENNPIHYLIEEFKIRLAPGALTEYGLKPGMVPPNPDGLTADQITEGGKYRAVANGEVIDSSVTLEVWVSRQKWIPQRNSVMVVYNFPGTCRVPVNTPFPKSPDSFQQELGEKLDALPAGELEEMLEQSSATPSHGIVSAYRDSEGWVMYGADQEPIEVWPEHWTERVTKEFLLSQGIEVDGEKRTPEQSSPVQSSTPRTDGILNMLKITWKTDTGYEHFVCAKEAAKIGIEDLETELTAALRERDEARVILCEARNALYGFIHPGEEKGDYIHAITQGENTLKQITNHLSK